MGINLDELDRVRSRWLPLAGQLRGVDLLIRYGAPREMERFRQKLIRLGVLKSGRGDGGPEINAGRDDEFFRLYAENFILDWRGDIKPEGTAYSPEVMGKVLGGTEAMAQVKAAVEDAEGFFEPANGG